MSPIREKLNSSLHKLGDKLKRVRSSEVIDATADIKVKQPRTLPDAPFVNTLLANPALLQKHRQPPHTNAGSLHVAYSDRLSSNGSLELPAHESKPIGTAGNPIDLTRTPPTASPTDLTFTSTFTSPNSMSATPATLTTDECDEDSSTHGNHADQVLEDSRLAWALQFELDRENDDRSPNPIHHPAALDASLRPFLTSLVQKKCPRCNSKTPITGDQVVSKTKSMLQDEGLLHPYLHCKRCRTWQCTGCGTCSDRSNPPVVNSMSGCDFKVSWCCDRSRLFLIWSLACGPDFQKLAMKPQGPNTSSVTSLKYRLRNRSKNLKPEDQTKEKEAPAQSKQESPSKSPVKAPSASSIMKGPRHMPSKLPKGTGYGGPDVDPMGWSKKRVATESKMHPSNRKKEQEKQAHSSLALYFHALKLVLPSWTRQHEAPFSPSGELGTIISAIMLRSPLLLRASEILRNDHVDDISEQDKLYNALLEFITGLADHYSTFGLLTNDLPLYRLEDQLVHISFDTERLMNNQSTKVEKSQSLLTLFGGLANQCRHFALASSAHLQAFGDEHEQNMLALAQRITQGYENVMANHQGMEIDLSQDNKPRGRVLGGDRGAQLATLTAGARGQETEDEARKSREQWHRQNSVCDIPDETLLETHSYAKAAEKMSSDTQTLGRMKKLVTQVASLRSSLPEGIYVRHCSTRLDVMKVLIVGPEGTPYENGLFEFDLFCPSNFPASPPVMQFRTTGGGTIRFNPNLYECGKVCLSLLGTWSGQRWTEQSTILQILVSIQAMILTDKPWYNEPGREVVTDVTASDRYNSQVQGWTLQHAMLYWLNERLARPPGKEKIPTRALPPRPDSDPNAQPPKTAKPGSTAASKSKLDPFNPSFQLMDDKPTKAQPKKHAPPFVQKSGKPKSSPTFKMNPEPFWSWGWGAPKVPSLVPLPDSPSQPPKLSQEMDTNGTAEKTNPVEPTGLEMLSDDLPQDFDDDILGWDQPIETNPPGKFPIMTSGWKPGDPTDMMVPHLFANMNQQAANLFSQDLEQLKPINIGFQKCIVPDSNTRIDSNDDYVWGPVIRAHFAAKATKILETAATWRTTGNGKLPEDPILQDLEEALMQHGFVPSKGQV